MSFDKRKIRVGRVLSDVMDKTVTVSIEWRRNHALYRKPVRRQTKLKVHDRTNLCKTGDLIKIIETRPISATKRWRLVEVIERASEAGIEIASDDLEQELQSVIKTKAVSKEKDPEILSSSSDTTDLSSDTPEDQINKPNPEQESD